MVVSMDVPTALPLSVKLLSTVCGWLPLPKTICVGCTISIELTVKPANSGLVVVLIVKPQPEKQLLLNGVEPSGQQTTNCTTLPPLVPLNTTATTDSGRQVPAVPYLKLVKPVGVKPAMCKPAARPGVTGQSRSVLVVGTHGVGLLMKVALASGPPQAKA